MGLVAVFLVKDVRFGEPHYKGVALSVWLKGYAPWTGDAWMRADEAVQAMGTNALPHLLARLQLPRTPARKFLLGSPFANEVEQFRALRACEALGPAALPLLPVLTNYFIGRSDGMAASALRKVGPEGIHVLIQGLSHGKESVRLTAIPQFELIPSSFGTLAVPALLPFLQHKDESIRATTARGLSAFPDQAHISVPALLPLLDDRSEWVRRDVIYALGHMGTNAEPAVSKLIELYRQDKSADVRFLARAYLHQINPVALRDAGITFD
jgi:HEAT repeat protein